jgi:CO dehydrogenase maturation factor
VHGLAKDIGIDNIAVVGNKIRNDTDRDFITSSFSGLAVAGFIPYDAAVVEADIAQRPVIGASPEVAAAVQHIFESLNGTAVPEG